MEELEVITVQYYRYEDWITYLRYSHSMSAHRARGAKGNLTFKEWLGVREYFGNRCARCGQDEIPFDYSSRLRIDHVVPVALGGSNKVSTFNPFVLSVMLEKVKEP